MYVCMHVRMYDLYVYMVCMHVCILQVKATKMQQAANAVGKMCCEFLCLCRYA
jgi:hypothetical protein